MLPQGRTHSNTTMALAGPAGGVTPMRSSRQVYGKEIFVPVLRHLHIVYGDTWLRLGAQVA